MSACAMGEQGTERAPSAVPSPHEGLHPCTNCTLAQAGHCMLLVVKTGQYGRDREREDACAYTTPSRMLASFLVRSPPGVHNRRRAHGSLSCA